MLGRYTALGTLTGGLARTDGTLFDSDPCHLAVFQELLLEQEGFNGGKMIDEVFERAVAVARA